MFVKPPGPRHTVTEDAQGLTIRIPAKRNFFIIGFLTLWLCGWFVGEVTGLISLFTITEEGPVDAVFMVLWVSFWTLGGAFALYAWLWQIKGCEVITFSPAALSIKRQVLGWGRSRQYDATQIRHLRVGPAAYTPFDFQGTLAFWGYGGSAIAFDYGFKTFRFGAGLDEAEARIILQTISGRFPALANGGSA